MAPPTVQTLQRLAAETGYRLETLEKVLRLLELLDEIAQDPVLSQRLALKGGTALNPAALGAALARWCRADPKPLVLLIDEIDTLIGDTLIAVLRQLRAGYVQRPGGFPQSVVLCGVRDVRDVRDYRIHSSTERAVVTGGGVFNIQAESLRLGDFTEAEVRALVAQHTEETGQAFTAEALETVWAQTLGQPWLVNALCARACFGDKAGRDRSRAITAEAVMAAREHLVQSRGPSRPARRQAPGGAGAAPGAAVDRYVVECKVLHKSPERTVAEGVEQTAAYMDRCDARAGHLVVFDRREGRTWEEKVFRREERIGERAVTVWSHPDGEGWRSAAEERIGEHAVTVWGM